MLGNMKITNYGDAGIYFGDTVFENGVFNMASTGILKRGCLLARDSSSGKFKKFTGTEDTPVAIYTGEDVEFTTSTDLPIRALIAGKVISNKILVDDKEASAAQKDLAKANGIIPVPFTEVGIKDNQ